VQIWKADKESRNAERIHNKEHDDDQLKIAALQQSVTILGQDNLREHDQDVTELHKLQDQVTELKLGKLTEEDRKKISLLEAQLKQALAPKPKAKLEFGFAYANMKKGEIRKDMYAPANGDTVKLRFSVTNVSETNASGISIWIRICDACKYHTEPARSEKPANSIETDRLYHIPEIPPGIALAEIAIEIEVPREFNRAGVSFFYRCPDCVLDEEPQVLWCDVGQIPIPKFSAPTPISKKKPVS
jgi:hypothetical protein